MPNKHKDSTYLVKKNINNYIFKYTTSNVFNILHVYFKCVPEQEKKQTRKYTYLRNRKYLGVIINMAKMINYFFAFNFFYFSKQMQ